MSDQVDTGRSLAERTNPGLEQALRERYDAWLPEGVADTVIGHGYGAVYARDGLDQKTRWLATIAALAALGGQTRPQLMVNALNAAIDVFQEKGIAP